MISDSSLTGSCFTVWLHDTKVDQIDTHKKWSYPHMTISNIYSLINHWPEKKKKKSLCHITTQISTALDSFIEENKGDRASEETHWQNEKTSKMRRGCVKENMRLIYMIEDPTSSNVLFPPLVQLFSLIHWPSMLSDMLTPTHTYNNTACVYVQMEKGCGRGKRQR